MFYCESDWHFAVPLGISCMCSWYRMFEYLLYVSLASWVSHLAVRLQPNGDKRNTSEVQEEKRRLATDEEERNITERSPSHYIIPFPIIHIVISNSTIPLAVFRFPLRSVFSVFFGMHFHSIKLQQWQRDDNKLRRIIKAKRVREIPNETENNKRPKPWAPFKRNRHRGDWVT